ncbi:hypothetical protein F5883DRAFT_442456, partial [Diaporthe sp. PMI_573]
RRGLPFLLSHDLLYHVDSASGSRKLCIPNALIKDVLEMAHDDRHHYLSKNLLLPSPFQSVFYAFQAVGVTK